MTRSAIPSLDASRFREGRILRWARSPEAPKMMRSVRGTTTKSYMRAGGDQDWGLLNGVDDVGPCHLVMDVAQPQGRERERRQPDNRLAGAEPGSIHRHTPL